MLLISKRRVRKIFQEQEKRVPNGFIQGMDALIRLVAEKTAGGEKVTEAEAVRTVNDKCPILGKYLSQAFDELEKAGKVDTEGKVSGGAEVWFTRARELQESNVSNAVTKA